MTIVPEEALCHSAATLAPESQPPYNAPPPESRSKERRDPVRRIHVLIALLLVSAAWAQQPIQGQPPTGGPDPREGTAKGIQDLLVPQDGVVAKVNQEIILGNEVYKKIASELEGLRRAYPDEESYTKKATELWRKTLRDMIEEKVMSMAAVAEGIKIEDRQVDKDLQDLIKKEGSVDKLKAKLAQQGFSLEDYRERIRTDLTQRELILTKLGFRQKQITPESKMPLDSFVTPRDIQQYYADNKKQFYVAEKVKSRQIVIHYEAATKAEKKAEAESVIRQIQHGADMALLALWYSAVHASDGGFWDWSERGNFPPEVDAVLFALKKGDLGAVVETKDAFVILRCEDREEPRQRQLGEDDVQDEIRKQIQNQKVNENVGKVKKQLVKEAYIEPTDLFEKP